METEKVQIVVHAILCEIVKGNVGVEIVEMISLSRVFLECGFRPIIQFSIFFGKLIVDFPESLLVNKSFGLWVFDFAP